MCASDTCDGEVVTLSGTFYEAQKLAPEDAWTANVDHAAFKEDVKNLGKTMAEQQGPEDVAHLHKIIRWQRTCSVIGMLTCWYCINPISIYVSRLDPLSQR